jgi:hypothetical protein
MRDKSTGWYALPGNEKKVVCRSFEVAMPTRVNQRLIEEAQKREPQARTASGTALVVVKNPLVEEAYAKLNLRFRSIKGFGAYDSGGRAAGRAAGDRVRFDRPVGDPSAKRLPGI